MGSLPVRQRRAKLPITTRKKKGAIVASRKKTSMVPRKNPGLTAAEGKRRRRVLETRSSSHLENTATRNRKERQDHPPKPVSTASTGEKAEEKKKKELRTQKLPAISYKRKPKHKENP